MTTKRLMQFPNSIIAALVFLSITFVNFSFSQNHVIKFATIAPEGSTWMNVMKEYDQAIRKESGGRLSFRMYPGNIQGDEKDVLRKIKLGQLHSAGITGVGMTSIAPKVRILDSPFLFKSYEEIDHIYQTFDNEFAKEFENGGYVNLGWAEVGFVYLFTNAAVREPADMRNVKMWMWEGDPVAEAMFSAFDIKPIPLSMTEVLTSLQTGLVNGVYSSPLGAIATQWFARTKYMLDLRLANASGAVVISKKKFDELSPELQEILVRNGKKYMQKLVQLSRKDNERSIETMKKNGMTITEPPKEKLANFETIGKQARQLMVGKLYPSDLLTRVESTVTEFRGSQAKSSNK